MLSWAEYLANCNTRIFHINVSDGFNGIAYVQRAIVDHIRQDPDCELSSEYRETVHNIVAKIDFKHFILNRRVDTYIFHDAIMYKFLPKWKCLILKYVQSRLLKRAKSIVCISIYAQRELARFHPESYAKSVVIYNNLIEKKRQKYVLWVGTEKTHKGLNNAVNCAEKLSCTVVMIGVKRNRTMPDNVICLTELPTVIYNQIMDGACALLVTSIDEGFHLPTLQALSANIDVFAMRLPVLDELHGPKVRSFDSLDDLTAELVVYVADSK